MQSFARAGSAFQIASKALALSFGVPLSIFSCSLGISIRSKTFVGQTVIQMPSAIQMSKSVPTAVPCTPYSLLTPSFQSTLCPRCSSFTGHWLGKLGSSMSFRTFPVTGASPIHYLPYDRAGGKGYKIVGLENCWLRFISLYPFYDVFYN